MVMSNGDDGDNGDNAGNDGDRFSDEFGDCSHGDGFDGVESLLLDENPILDNMFAPLYTQELPLQYVLPTAPS